MLVTQIHMWLRDVDFSASNDTTSAQIKFLPFPPERDPHEPVAAQVLRPRGGRLWLLLDGRRRGVHEAEASDAGPAEENFDKATTESETAIGIIISNNAFQNRGGRLRSQGRRIPTACFVSQPPGILKYVLLDTEE